MITLNIVLPSPFVLDLGPGVLGQLPSILQIGDKLLASIADLKSQFQAAIADLKTTFEAEAAAENAQVLAAIQALQDQLTAALANASNPTELADFATMMTDGFADLKGSVTGDIEGVFVPPTTPTP